MKVLEKLLDENKDFEYRVEGKVLRIVGANGSAYVKLLKHDHKGCVFSVECVDNNCEIFDAQTEYHLFHGVQTGIWMLKELEKTEVA